MDEAQAAMYKAADLVMEVINDEITEQGSTRPLSQALHGNPSTLFGLLHRLKHKGPASVMKALIATGAGVVVVKEKREKK